MQEASPGHHQEHHKLVVFWEDQTGMNWSPSIGWKSRSDFQCPCQRHSAPSWSSPWYISDALSLGQESGVFGKASGVGCPPPRRGTLFSTNPTPPPKMRGPYIACVIFVERDHESASNYPHGNYRMVLPTEHVQRSLGEPPRTHHLPQAQTPGSRHYQAQLKHAPARVEGPGLA